MKTCFPSFAFIASLFVGVVQAADRFSPPIVAPILGHNAPGEPRHKFFFQTLGTCWITDVQVEEMMLTVSYNGAWTIISGAKSFPRARTSLTIHRDKSASAKEWNALVQRFNDAREKSVNLLVFLGDEFVMKNGKPSFTFPGECFQVVLPGESYSFPVGYKF